MLIWYPDFTSYAGQVLIWYPDFTSYAGQVLIWYPDFTSYAGQVLIWYPDFTSYSKQFSWCHAHIFKTAVHRSQDCDNAALQTQLSAQGPVFCPVLHISTVLFPSSYHLNFPIFHSAQKPTFIGRTSGRSLWLSGTINCCIFW